jgi:ribosomal protein L29
MKETTREEIKREKGELELDLAGLRAERALVGRVAHERTAELERKIAHIRGRIRTINNALAADEFERCDLDSERGL